MPKFNALWSVVEVIDAPDEEAALTELRARLTRAGFTAYEGTYDLVPDGYKLAYLSDDQGEESPATGYYVEMTPGGYRSTGLIEDTQPHPFSTPDGNKTYCRTCGATRIAGNHPAEGDKP